MSLYYKALTECGIPIALSEYALLDEAAELKVADAELTAMMKFITDKYNAIDFKEIEKSAGDIKRFKYREMIYENLETLKAIYENSPDPGAVKYKQVVIAIWNVMDHLRFNNEKYSFLYKKGNGIVQLMYTSLVAGCLYATGTLVSNTIRFVTTESDTECEVLYDEIPGSIKHVHIKNILAADQDIGTFNRVLDTFYTDKKPISESITLGTVAAAVIGAAAVITMIPKVIVLIREIIYSIYYSRVKTADMLDLQIQLIRVNIESLENNAGPGKKTKKIIARQRKIAQLLESWKNKVALKMDTTAVLKNTQIKKENNTLKLDKDNPLLKDPSSSNSDDLMI